MGGWKTKTGGLIMSIAPFLSMLFPTKPFLSEMVAASGAALMGIGIGHKIEKK